jgi:hypothetical protein
MDFAYFSYFYRLTLCLLLLFEKFSKLEEQVLEFRSIVEPKKRAADNDKDVNQGSNTNKKKKPYFKSRTSANVLTQSFSALGVHEQLDETPEDVDSSHPNFPPDLDEDNDNEKAGSESEDEEETSSTVDDLELQWKEEQDLELLNAVSAWKDLHARETRC